MLRSDIYQIEDKALKANFLGLPFGSFFKLPYKNYIELCQDFNGFQKEAENWYRNQKHYNDQTLSGEVWVKYREYCKLNKIKTGLEKWQIES